MKHLLDPSFNYLFTFDSRFNARRCSIDMGNVCQYVGGG